MVSSAGKINPLQLKPKKKKLSAFDRLNYILMILIMIVMLYPIWYVVILSFSDPVQSMRGGVYLWPAGFSLEAYGKIINHPGFFTYYGNTIFYTFFGTIYNVLMTAMCAYPLSRKNLYGRSLFTTLVLVPMFFGGGMIPSFLLIRNLGMIDTRWALIIPGAISTWNMIVMRTFFQNIPESLMESAYIDGANDLQVLKSIVLPLSAPIFATMTLFYAVGHWNSYFSAVLYINDNDLLPVQILLRNIVINGEVAASDPSKMSGQENVNAIISANFKYATIMLVMAPILCVYPFVQKHFVKGVMVGALKG